VILRVLSGISQLAGGKLLSTVIVGWRKVSTSQSAEIWATTLFSFYILFHLKESNIRCTVFGLHRVKWSLLFTDAGDMFLW
jgi:uncharacterized membrane protein